MTAHQQTEYEYMCGVILDNSHSLVNCLVPIQYILWGRILRENMWLKLKNKALAV